MYVIRKISSDLLFYVDRNKTKRFWWSYNPKYALLFTSKEQAEKKVESLNYGKFEVITESEMHRLRDRKDQSHNDKIRDFERNYDYHNDDHPFSSEALGQWND